METINDEIWKDIIGYEGLYKISNYGNIKNRHNKIRKSKYNRYGYLQLNLSNNGILKTLNIHRLVALAFLDNPDKKPAINHIDGNKQNNHVSNLEWVTHSENSIHSFNNKLQIPLINEAHPNYKISNNDVLTIRKLYNTNNYSQSELAMQFNCSQTCISKIIRYVRRKL